MKNTKICFHKSVGVGVLVMLFAGIFAFLTFQLSKQQISTNTRATAPAKDIQPKSSSPIIGGEMAKDGEFPFHATLFTKSGWLFCGGALISKEWVLTAGHCLDDYKEEFGGDPMEIEVMIGLDHIDRDMKALHYSAVDKIYLHENFTFDEFALYRELNDIALIHLKDPAKYIPTLSLFDPQGNKKKYLERMNSDKEATIMGFGAINAEKNNLQYSYSNDLKKITKVSLRKKSAIEPNDKFHLVSQDGSMPCAGDSGGPALLTYNGIIYVIGIMISGCKVSDVYFTSTSHYYPWIHDKSVEFARLVQDHTQIINADSGTYNTQTVAQTTKAMPICTKITNINECDAKSFLCSWDSSASKCVNNPKGR